MNSRTTQTPHPSAADEDAIRAIHQQMIDAWNRGSGEAFAAPFTDDANFVAFEGTHLKGRQEVATFHQRIFDTLVKGSRLEGEVKFVRFPQPPTGRDALSRQNDPARASRGVTGARFDANVSLLRTAMEIGALRNYSMPGG